MADSLSLSFRVFTAKLLGVQILWSFCNNVNLLTSSQNLPCCLTKPTDVLSLRPNGRDLLYISQVISANVAAEIKSQQNDIS